MMSLQRSPFPSVLILVVAMIAATSNGNGQDSEPSPTPSPTPSAEEVRLQDEIRLLTLQKQKAQAEKDLRNVNLPTSASTPSPASATFAESDKLDMEVEMQSYKAMKRITDNIACDIRKIRKEPFIIAFHNIEDYAAWRNYNLVAPTLTAQLAGMKTEYKAWLTQQPRADLSHGVASATEKMIDLRGVPITGSGSGGSPGLGATTAVVSTGLAGLSGSVKAFAELMSLFQSDVSFTNKAVTLKPEAIKSSLARSFRDTQATGSSPSCGNTHSVTIFDPANFAPATSPGGAFKSPVLSDIKELAELHRVATIRIALFEVVEADLAKLAELEKKVEAAKAAEQAKRDEVAGLEDQLDEAEAKNKPPIKRALLKARSELTALENETLATDTIVTDFKGTLEPYRGERTIPNRIRISRLKALNSEFAAFLTAFTQSSNSGATLLSQYVKAQNLNAALSQGNLFWLRINGVQAGGNTRTVKNLFRYFYKPGVRHSGGAILEYSVTDRDGSVLVANTDAIYLKYEKASNIQK